MSKGLPNGWVACTLNDIARWGSGGTPSRKNKGYYDGIIPWVKTGELGNKYVYDTEEKITEDATKASNAKVFPAGSVAVAMYGATIGKTSILGMDASTNQACSVGFPLGGIPSEFLYYLLFANREEFIRQGRSAAKHIPGIYTELSDSTPPPCRTEANRGQARHAHGSNRVVQGAAGEGSGDYQAVPADGAGVGGDGEVDGGLEEGENGM